MGARGKQHPWPLLCGSGVDTCSVLALRTNGERAVLY